MKKTIAFIAALALMLSLFATVAYAQGNGNAANHIDNKINKLSERLKALEEIKPLIRTIAENRLEIGKLQKDLRNEHQVAQKHINVLKSDPAGISNEKLEQIKSIVAEIKQVRTELKNTNANMAQEKKNLRDTRKNKNYEGVKAAYQRIIQIQEGRISKYNALIGLYKKLSAI